MAVKGTDVLGFLLAYSDAQIEPDEWLNHQIKTTLGSFLVIKQVCVARDASRQGVASRLYHHVLERWTANPVIAAGLAATLAFTLGKEGAQSQEVARGVGAVITVIGFVSGLAFAVMLRYGRRYLQTRKSTVVELEEHMAWHGGQRIVGRRLTEPGSGWLQASPTGLVMVLLPVFVSLGWLAMLVVVLTN
ncbi:hypothetical protein ACFZAM_20790 [Streptomyces sp. NPDC008079]|uniref:hypothetical protein n=1 Tax=Streptomyces sp. NPDC008079 TaxID=3364806 RepID=UPI0036E0FFC8